VDEHYPWSNFQQRYASHSGASTRAWGPYYLGAYDLGAVKRSGALFVRKVSSKVDENVLRLLPVDDHAHIPDLFWPAQLPLYDPTAARAAATGEAGVEAGASPSGGQGGDVAVAPAPAPAGEGYPGVAVLAKGEVGHVDARGCVHVAESIHCPPKHHIDPATVAQWDLPVGVGFGG